MDIKLQSHKNDGLIQKLDKEFDIEISDEEALSEAETKMKESSKPNYIKLK